MIIQGDCLEQLSQLADKSVDLIIIDPPYNIGKADWDKIGYTQKGYQPKPYSGTSYYDWMEQVFIQLDRVMKDSGSFWFFHNDFRIMSELDRRIQQSTSFEFRNMVVWNKLFPGAQREAFLKGFVQVEGLNNFQKMVEYIMFYTRKDLHLKLKQRRLELGIKSTDISREILSRNGNLTGWYSNIETGKNLPTEKTIVPITKHLGFTMADLVPTFNNQCTSHSVWNYEFDAEKMGHLTPKPVDLLSNIILHCSNPGDVVLDCFAGSGSTALAARATGRQFILIEKEPEYVDIIHRRLAP